jgi:hypothetical protein
VFNTFHGCVTPPSRPSRATHICAVRATTARALKKNIKTQEMIMKTLASALIALSVLTGVASTASAAEPAWVQELWAQVERNSR